MATKSITVRIVLAFLLCAAGRIPTAAQLFGGGIKTITVLVSPTTGRVWMDRNLGASRRAVSNTDVLSYGDLYQWCRNADGHQLRTSSLLSGTLTSGSTAAVSGSVYYGKFLYGQSTPFDWLDTQVTSGSLWWNGTAVGANNPCPAGFHVPTYTEWNAELSDVTSLKLPFAGRRYNANGTFGDVGTIGYYWCATVSNTDAKMLIFSSSGVNMNATNRAAGLSVRCIKN